MAHELYTMADGRYAMARSADTQRSWHGLENVIPEDASFDTWMENSGMGFKINKSQVQYMTDEGMKIMNDRVVLSRNDTGAALSVVGSGYHVVQPREVLHFFQDLCQKHNLKMDTAGVIRGGVKFWALARTGEQVVLHNGDKIKQYLLLATSADHSMATIAKHTTTRVVCSNTFHLNINNGEKAIKVNHSSAFDANQVKLDLGLLDAEFKSFKNIADELADHRVTTPEARRWFAEMFSGETNMDLDAVNAYAHTSRMFTSAWNSYKEAPGAEDTLWGLFNGVTHMVDHVRGRTVDSRLDSSMFGTGALLKQQAWKKVLECNV
jgi:phage/plasmid-like protein (TIGR03299 family)